MTDQELIARLRDAPADGLGTENLCLEAADRIEALVKERDEALNQLDSARHSVDVLEKRLTDKMAKLAKAVEALRETTQMLSQCTFTIIRMKGQYFERHEVVDKAHAVLAELEGKDHD